MLNSSLNKKILLLTLLTSVATLTACGNKEAQSVPSSSSSATAKVTSKSSTAASQTRSTAATVSGRTSSAVATVASQTSSTETQVEEEGSETSSEEVATEATATESEQESSPVQAEPSSLPTTFDLNGLSAGDYSSIAGTWANAEGKVFTVTADGVLYFGEAFDENAHHKIEQAGLNSHGRVGGSLGYYRNGERAGGAHISIVPAGVANILDEVDDVDHIEIGHDVSSGYPEQQFFRQD